MKRVTRLAWLVVVAIGTSPQGARADEKDASAPASAKPATTSLTGEAKALYELGRELFERGDVAAALVKFTRAYELSSDARLLWNMAACEASLKHWARAMTLVDRYLANAGSVLTEEDRQKADRFRAAAKPLVASVKLTTSPDGATISVDGETVGTTPLTMLYLDVGKRRVHVTKGGYRGLVRVETVAGGSDLTWSITLERLRVKPL
jgi:hypothetical protein